MMLSQVRYRSVGVRLARAHFGTMPPTPHGRLLSVADRRARAQPQAPPGHQYRAL